MTGLAWLWEAGGVDGIAGSPEDSKRQAAERVTVPETSGDGEREILVVRC